VAGHPLRPATDQSLGEPLPRQLANRARAPPPTAFRPLSPTTEVIGMSYGISPPFGGLSPFGGQVAHVLLTRAPCAGLVYCYTRLRTRLACVRHAASVRSEPGSNSRLKLVVLKLQIPAVSRDMSFRTNFLCRSIHSKTERVLARLIQLSKSGPPVLQAGYSARENSSTTSRIVKDPPQYLLRIICGGQKRARHLENSPSIPPALRLGI